MEELIYVYLGLASAAFILCLLALIISRRQTQKGEQTATEPSESEVKPSPNRQPQQAKETPQAEPSPQKPSVVPDNEGLDQIIQIAFSFMEKHDYQKASATFQAGLKMTSDPKITVQLHLELAKIYNISKDKEKALRHLDQALQVARKDKNGATEQELLGIKQMIISQSSS